MRPAGLPVGAVWAGLVVSAESGHGSVGVADADSRSRAGPATVWVSAHLDALASRRLVGESDAGRRLDRLEGLQRRMRVRRRMPIAVHRGPAPIPVGLTEQLSMDFTHDSLADGLP